MMIPSGSAEKSDPPHFFGLLRSRGQRPCCCGTAQKLDEFPSPHAIYSPAENHLKSNPLFDRAPCTRIATKRGYRCLSWVISRHVRCKRACPLYPRKRTCAVQLGMSAKCGGFNRSTQHSISFFLLGFESQGVVSDASDLKVPVCSAAVKPRKYPRPSPQDSECCVDRLNRQS